MRYVLKRHADTPCAAVTEIAVEVTRPRPEDLSLLYTVSGEIAKILLPPAAAPERMDNLWKTTCFEAFFRRMPDEAYNEFNFSPSSRWAAYRFDAFRSGMRDALELGDPGIVTTVEPTRFELRASAALSRMAEFSASAPYRVALSAIIEETNGQISFWALAHPPVKADFHHSDCFAIDLPQADTP